MNYYKFTQELSRLEDEGISQLNIDEREALQREFKSICAYHTWPIEKVKSLMGRVENLMN